MLGGDWLRFRDDWYASFLHQRIRRDLYKEEMRYKVLGERYHNYTTINLPLKRKFVSNYGVKVYGEEQEPVMEEVEINPEEELQRLKDWGYFDKGDKAVIEFNTEKGQHVHFHIVSYKKRKQKNIIRDCAKKFRVKEPAIDNNCIATLYDKHIDYINGVKQDKKMENVEEDREWRSENNLPELIIF